MDLNELKQYENVIFPNIDVLQKTIENIFEYFQHLKGLHDGIPDNNGIKQLNRHFSDLVGTRAEESSMMSMDLEEFADYFKMLTKDDVTVNDLLKTLLVLKDVAENRINSSKKLKNEF